MEWQKFPLDERYEVTRCGKVRSAKTKHIHAQFSVQNRPYVSLGHKLYQVHRVVAWTYIGAKPHDKAHCCHKDGNAWNNDVSNLYWGDSKTNGRDKRRLGEARGENNGRSRLSKEQVLEVAALKGMETDAATARRLGVGTATISHIRTGKNWSYLTGIKYGESSKPRKLDAKRAREIRDKLSNGHRVTELARQYGVQHESIRAVRDGRFYKEEGA